jgi:hypothetical protein
LERKNNMIRYFINSVNTGLLAAFLINPFAARIGEAAAPLAPLPTKITVSSSLNPSTAAQSVTLTAFVSPVGPNPGAPTGTVEFIAGPASLGSVPLTSDGSNEASASITVTFQPGLYPVVVRYSGDANFAFNVSLPPMAQSVVSQ